MAAGRLLAARRTPTLGRDPVHELCGGQCCEVPFLYRVLDGICFWAPLLFHIAEWMHSLGSGTMASVADERAPRGGLVIDVLGLITAMVITEIATRYW